MGPTHDLAGTNRMTEQPGGARIRRPTIVANPAGDRDFDARVEDALRAGARRPIDLELALRAAYPNVVVRRREISGESIEVWYVYRDGHWVAKEADAQG
jgi:hypothetical protein